MPLKKIKPTTPGQRFRIAPNFDAITQKASEKKLLVTMKKSGGRNNSGRITISHRGGGHKKKIRVIDFQRSKKDVSATVRGIEYDPNRSAHIALLYYTDGQKSYILAPESLSVGDSVVAGEKVLPETGNAMPMKNMPLGTYIHNIELTPGKGGALARSAGTRVQLVAKDGKYVTIKLPSGEMRMVLGSCMATVGVLSNSEHMNICLGKAGRNRWLGRKPRVRGVAMNPVDHPMGGGEGKASGGHPRSFKGLYAKGKKTANNKKYAKKLIISKRKK